MAIFREAELAQALFEAVRPHVPARMSGGNLVGIGHALRVYRYVPGDFFHLHRDQKYRHEGLVSHLAVLTYLGVWLFARPESGDDWLAGASHFIELPRGTLQTSEAVTWLDANTLLIANEERDLLTLDVSSLP